MRNARQTFLRLFIYLAGIIILAFGIVLNTKTNMGVSAIISVPFSIAAVWGINLGVMTFFFYVFCIFMQWVLDRKNFGIREMLQIVVSFITSWFINLFDQSIPMAPDSLALRFLVLSMAIVATGFGSSLIVMMELAANPADGFARTLGKLVGREFGFGKNMMDLGCVAISASIGLLFGGRIVGIGVGTVFSAIFIGRYVALTNWLIKSRVQRAVGI